MVCFEVPSRWEFEAVEKKGASDNYKLLAWGRWEGIQKKVYLVNGRINYFFGCSFAKEEKKKKANSEYA